MGKRNDTRPTPDSGTAAMTQAMMTGSPVVAKAWLSFMSESAQFLTERLQQDLEAQKAMMACKSPTELLKVQSDFLTAAMDQYTDYATRLCKTMTTAATNPVQDMQSGQSRRYDDIPL
ncbi:phasin family protein [Pseudotabrizicola sp.]|uniref:phasin family protein n=1 Tax=Pseudotabrizicola sp. TaxID=2939647 RepID=UPI002726DC70|nr:phasin family protein [Pseudotabrizicola sp.]MDO8884583.1 phasin family protein [Pseudotabrizicola sp.]